MNERGPRIAILASGDRKTGGGGSTADAVAREALMGKVQLQIGVVICNNPPESVGVYDYFEQINKDYQLKGDSKIDVINIGPNTHPGGKLERGQTLDESAAVVKLLEGRDIAFAAMLGYLRILTGEFIDTWGWKPAYADDPTFGYSQGRYHPKARIMNNHPAILPFTKDTHGEKAHQKAVDLYRTGTITHTAMTWHLASEDVDQGPVVNEIPVAITENDTASTLGERVQMVEKAQTAQEIARHITLRDQHLRLAA